MNNKIRQAAKDLPISEHIEFAIDWFMDRREKLKWWQKWILAPVLDEIIFLLETLKEKHKR